MADTGTDNITDPGAEPAPVPGTKLPGMRNHRGGLIALLAIALALVAALVAGSAWWDAGQIEQELLAYRQGLLGSVEDTSGDLLLLSETLDDFQSAQAERDARLQSLNDDLAALAAEIRAVGRRVDGLQGGRLDARDNWLREQIEYYLVLANSELNVRRETAGAIEALELADDGLLELGDPGLGDVRRAVASELQALRAVPTPDIEGLVLDLAALQSGVAELPMRAGGPDNYVSAPDADDEEVAGLGRLWDRTKGAVSSVVRIEREDGPVELTLTEAERRVIRRQLELELQVARSAVADRRQDDLRASLAAADATLLRDFDQDARSVIAARETLARLMQVELTPPLPDISDSLLLLRDASGDR